MSSAVHFKHNLQTNKYKCLIKYSNSLSKINLKISLVTSIHIHISIIPLVLFFDLQLQSTNVLVTLTCLVYVFLNILTLKLPHSLNLIQVDDEALVIGVIQLDALTTEYRLMIRTIEMLYAFGVLQAELVRHRVLVFVLKIKIALCQLLVFLDDLV